MQKINCMKLIKKLAIDLAVYQAANEEELKRIIKEIFKNFDYPDYSEIIGEAINEFREVTGMRGYQKTSHIPGMEAPQ